MVKIKDQLLVTAREALTHVWNLCKRTGFVGRCYPQRTVCESPYPGSNITLCSGREVVIVYLSRGDQGGELKAVSFMRSEELGPLGREVLDVLEANGLVGKGASS